MNTDNAISSARPELRWLRIPVAFHETLPQPVSIAAARKSTRLSTFAAGPPRSLSPASILPALDRLQATYFSGGLAARKTPPDRRP